MRIKFLIHASILSVCSLSVHGIVSDDADQSRSIQSSSFDTPVSSTQDQVLPGEKRKILSESLDSFFARFAEQTEMLNIQIQEEILALKRRAAQQILSVVAQAESDALKEKNTVHEELARQELSCEGNLSMDRSWKERLNKDFSENLMYLENVILQGETAQEAEDFIKRFRSQMQWFRSTLAATNNQQDIAYYQLHQKTAALANIVGAHKKTLVSLKNKLSSEEYLLPEYNKLKLIALYEINSLIQQKNGDGIAAIAATTLSKDDIQNIVATVLAEAHRQNAGMPASIIHDNTLTTPETKNFTYAQHPTTIQQSLQLPKIPTYASIPPALIDRIEETSKENLQLQTIILDKDQKITDLKQENRLLQQIAEEHKILSGQAAARQSLTEELADGQIRDYKDHFDTKKTLLHEQMEQLSLQEQILALKTEAAIQHEKSLDERHSWLEKLLKTLSKQCAIIESKSHTTSQNHHTGPSRTEIELQEQTIRKLLELDIESRMAAEKNKNLTISNPEWM